MWPAGHALDNSVPDYESQLCVLEYSGLYSLVV